MKNTWQFALVLVFLMGTASPVFADPQVDKDLRAKVAAYWTAIEERDWATAYRLEKQAQDATPLDPFQYYQGKDAEPRYRFARLESVKQDGETATAVVYAMIVLPLGPKAFDIPRYFESDWERVGGEWYHVRSKAFRPKRVDKDPDASDGPAGANEAVAGDSKTVPPPPDAEGEPDNQ